MLIVQSVVVGMLVVLAGTIPRNLLFAGNLRYGSAAPWAVPLTAAYLWFFWRYLQGSGPPLSTAEQRKSSLRANRISLRLWIWSLFSGGLGIIALVIALRIANRLVVLPPQRLPDLSHVPRLTVLSLLIAAAPVAGIVEEAAFRGYMQAPIERRFGPVIAILITGIMFAAAHLDFTLVLLPYYMAVAAIYGTVTYLTNSILPAIVLHTLGNLYSNFDLWLHGQAEWQAASGATGADASFWIAFVAFTLVSSLMLCAYFMLAHAARESKAGHRHSA